MGATTRLRAAFRIGLITAVLWSAVMAALRLGQLLFTKTDDVPVAVLPHLAGIFVSWLPVGFASGCVFSIVLALSSRWLMRTGISPARSALAGLAGGAGAYWILAVLVWPGRLLAGIPSAMLVEMSIFGLIGAAASVALVGVARRGVLPPVEAEKLLGR